MDAFDADVLIYAADPGNILGRSVARLFDEPAGIVGSGSLLLIPEVLTRPIRAGDVVERDRLAFFLARLTLQDVDAEVTEWAVQFGAKYGLKTVDSIHLATAVLGDADRFITNNRAPLSGTRSLRSTSPTPRTST